MTGKKPLAGDVSILCIQNGEVVLPDRTIPAGASLSKAGGFAMPAIAKDAARG